MLNSEFGGRDFRKNINDYFANSILSPDIDPDLSKIKIDSVDYYFQYNLTEFSS